MKIYSLIILTTLISSSLNAINIAVWKKPELVPVPQDNPITPKKIELGKLLFFDKRLSKSDDISCATCHNPKLGWSDGMSKSRGDGGKIGRRNSPTIINSAYLNNFFHDGRASSLEEQALGPIETEVEMNMPIDKLVKKLNAISGYRELFFEAFGDKEINKENVLKAIATFERTINTPDTAFDRWIAGDKDALTRMEKVGYEVFTEDGRCHSCHNGFNFTNENFSNIGLGDEKDLGLYELNEKKNMIWYGAFKTPTLRNIEKTAPYFHDGSVNTLKEAVHICGNGGRKPVKIKSVFFWDRRLNDELEDLIIVFLKTLTSDPINIEIPKEFPR